MAQKISPCLWFDGNAKEAIDFYLSVFSDGKLLSTEYYPKSKAEGLADFQKDMAGKEFAISCKDQDEIDYYWEKLSSVPEAEMCGWCKDRFGLSWQIVPQNVGELLTRPGGYAHMMQMKKLVIDDF